MSTQPQPAPVLAWHREAAWKVNLIHTNGDWSDTENPGALIASVIAAHDPHAAQTAEAYFLDKDLFVNYIADKVNPARLAEGLAVISNWQANVCYDVLTSRRYLAKLKGTK